MNQSKFIFLILLTPLLLFSQMYQDTPAAHADEYGLGGTIAMSGFGLGGYYRFALNNFFHLGANIDFYMMRDEKEFSYYYYDPIYQYSYPIEFNKFNRLFIVPVNVELKKRLFSDTIEDSFRPYLIGLAGGIFGVNFPRNDERQLQFLTEEQRNTLPQNTEYRFTLSFALGAGIDFSTNDDYYISIRPQYRFIYFPESIAAKKNHSAFEIRFELGKRNL